MARPGRTAAAGERARVCGPPVDQCPGEQQQDGKLVHARDEMGTVRGPQKMCHDSHRQP